MWKGFVTSPINTTGIHEAMEVANSYKRARGSKYNNKIVTFEYFINTLVGQIFPSLSHPFKSATFSLLLVNPAPYNTRVKTRETNEWTSCEKISNTSKNERVYLSTIYQCVLTRVLNASKTADHRVNAVWVTFS